ncbi:MAG: YjbQ family protein [Bacteroidales bacterium]|nr:YjbQ family protein [Bacteroidales bacterium]
MITQKEITLPAFKRGFHLITHLIEKQISDFPEQGILNIFIKHTSAGITINENADESVRDDFEEIFNRIVPENMPYYTHTLEGSDDMPAHIKSSLLSSTLSIPITNQSLNMGIWQGIYLCEFRNHGGRRKLILTIYS